MGHWYLEVGPSSVVAVVEGMGLAVVTVVAAEVVGCVDVPSSAMHLVEVRVRSLCLEH